MAVYERTYKGYRGSLTPEWSRFLVLPKYTYQRVFSSKLFLMFFVSCLIPTLVGMTIIYLRHNLTLLESLGIRMQDMALINNDFFHIFLRIQGLGFGFVLALIIGPPLVSSDLANNGLPLYFSRPLSRTEYVLGKMSILVILLSCITWIPNLLMFFLKAYMAGDGWLWENYRIGMAIFASSWVWIITLSLITLAISASVKRKAAARILLFGVFFILSTFGGIIGELIGIWWGHNLQVLTMTDVVWAGLFDTRTPSPVTPEWSAWLTLIIACGLSLLFLRRKIRAYEIVR